MTHPEQAEDKHYFNSKFPCILYDKNSPVAAHSIPYPDAHICVADLRDHVTMIGRLPRPGRRFRCWPSPIHSTSPISSEVECWPIERKETFNTAPSGGFENFTVYRCPQLDGNRLIGYNLFCIRKGTNAFICLSVRQHVVKIT